jgi:hypothetical protein
MRRLGRVLAAIAELFGSAELGPRRPARRVAVETQRRQRDEVARERADPCR